MNNWRLLLLAVIAVLQPIPSFTESNLIDGHRECCAHRSNSIAPDIRLYGTFGKSGFEDRRLEYRVSRQGDAASSSRERLALERTERRISPRLDWDPNTDIRLGRNEARQSRFSFERDGDNRRIRETRATDQYERDVAYSRGARMSRDDARTNILGNERSHRVSVETRRELNRDSTTEETMAVFRRERDYVDRFLRDSRFSSMSRLHMDNARNRILASRRNFRAETRASRSLNSRISGGNDREELRNVDRTNFERISRERKERDLTRAPSVLTHADRRISFDPADRRLNNRNNGERFSIGTYEYQTNYRDNNERRQRDESRHTRQRFILRESATDKTEARLLRNLQSERSSEGREMSKNIPQLSKNIATERDERFSRNQRDARSVDRLDGFRRETRMSRIQAHTESRDGTQRYEIRNSQSSSRSDSESRIQDYRDSRNDLNRRDREGQRYESRQNVINRMVRDNERSQERRSSRHLLPARQSSFERVSRKRDEISDLRQIRHENKNSRDRSVEPLYNRRMRESPVVRSRSTDGVRDSERREMNRESDTRESRHRISTSRLSRETVGEHSRRESFEVRMTPEGGKRKEITRNREDVRDADNVVFRRDYSRVNRDSVSLQKSTEIRAVRSFEERRENIRVESIRNDKQNIKISTTNDRDLRTKPGFKQMETREDRAYLTRLTEKRIQDKVRSTDGIFNVGSSRNMRYNTLLANRQTKEIRPQNLEAGEKMTENQKFNWKMVFYSLQGAYLCGLLVNILTEKTNKGYPRNFSFWAPKDLIKVD